MNETCEKKSIFKLISFSCRAKTLLATTTAFKYRESEYIHAPSRKRSGAAEQRECNFIDPMREKLETLLSQSQLPNYQLC